MLARNAWISAKTLADRFWLQTVDNRASALPAVTLREYGDLRVLSVTKAIRVAADDPPIGFVIVNLKRAGLQAIMDTSGSVAAAYVVDPDTGTILLASQPAVGARTII